MVSTGSSTSAGRERVGAEINVKGELHLTVDKHEYRAGDVVTGRVTMLVSEQLECDALVCTILGEEMAQWKEDGDHHSRYHELLRQEVLHSVLPSPCDVGEYLYPLQFTLPAELPGVLDAQALDGDVMALHATIKYTLLATVKVQGRFVSNLEASVLVTVRANTKPPADFHVVERTVSKELRWLGCLHRGTCHLAITMPRDVFALGDSPLVECFVNNHTSAVGVSRMKVLLNQRVTLHQPHGVDHVCTRTIIEAKCPGPLAGDLLECPVQLATDGHLHFPTTKATFLSCSYSICLQCEFSSMMASPVRLELPITIIPPPRRPNTVDLAASLLSSSSARPQISLFD